MHTPSATITLYLSARDKIIALPGGTGRRWAEAALDLAGFTEDQDHIHTLSLDDRATARQALTHLHLAARDCQVTVATHPRPYLGDIAKAVVAASPGHWEATVLGLQEQQDQNHLRDYLWETSTLYGLLEKNRLGFAAILRDGGGTELLLVERPSDGSYVVGALVPSPDHLNATAPPPRSIIASDARTAARFIHTRLLPDYERAVHLSRLREAEEDLRWAQQKHEPGVAYDTVDLEAALDRFRAHAAAFIATLRSGEPLPPEQALFLDRVEDGLSLDEPQGLNTEALANAEAVWLIDGGGLIEMARAATLPLVAAAPAEAPSAGPRAQPLPPSVATSFATGTSPRR